MIKRLFLAFAFITMFGVSRGDEQPPYDVKDPAIIENFRNIYLQADKLSLLSTLFSYTLSSTANLFCIDSPTFCVDAGNHRIGIGTSSPSTLLHLSSGTLTIDGTSSGISVGGSTFVVVGGRVGIGTSSPASLLHLSSGVVTIDGTSPQLYVAGASNQLVFGVGSASTTVSFSAPSAARTYTVPDITANGNFSLREATETYTAQKTFQKELLAPNGAAGGPAYSFSGSTTTGMFVTGINSLRFAWNGQDLLGVTSGGVSIDSGTFSIQDGTVGSPALTFLAGGNNDNGIYRIGTDSYGFSAAGAKVWGTTAAGSISQPLQPSFLEHLSSNMNNVTGDGTTVTINYNDEVYDQASNFAASTFTAPVDGRYLLAVNIKLEGIGTTHTSIDGFIVTSNHSYIITYNLPGAAAITEYSLPLSVVADMDANDQAYVQITVNGTGKTADVSGAASFRNVFSGSLIN